MSNAMDRIHRAVAPIPLLGRSFIGSRLEQVRYPLARYLPFAPLLPSASAGPGLTTIG